jgi:uncharacterized membrane protein YjjP (DUF1212 family)
MVGQAVPLNGGTRRRCVSQEITMSMAQSFGRSALARFVNSPTGRVVRVVVGIALILWGYTRLGSSAGVVLIVVGLIPLLAGVFDLCLVSALLGGPISGSRVGKGGE